MNEHQWLTADQVPWLLSHAEMVVTHRELALFQIECARQLIEVEDDSELSHLCMKVEDSLQGDALSTDVETVRTATHRYAVASAELLFQGVAEAHGRNRHFVRQLSQAAVAANLLQEAVSPGGWWRATTDIDEGPELAFYCAFDGFREVWCQQNIPLLRCIVGNPFHPVTFDPSWRTEAAIGLALRMYDDRDFAAMPILADALEEAGCENADVLSHCREPGPHARGCWVVDEVLGKR